jgi:hypothetical protein
MESPFGKHSKRQEDNVKQMFKKQAIKGSTMMRSGKVWASTKMKMMMMTMTTMVVVVVKMTMIMVMTLLVQLRNYKLYRTLYTGVGHCVIHKVHVAR